MRNTSTTFIALFLCLLARTAIAQTPITEKLKHKLSISVSSEDKLACLLELCDEFQSLNKDTFYNYVVEARLLAVKADERSRIRTELALANAYMNWGWLDSSLAITDQLLQAAPADKPDTRDLYFKIARQRGLAYGNKSQYTRALEIFYETLRQAEQYRDTLSYCLIANSIGSVAIARNDGHEALRWINRALAVMPRSAVYLQARAPAYINGGFAYMLLEQNDSAEYFLNAALPLCRQIQNLHYLATALRLQTNLYTNAGKFKAAEAALLEMMAVRKKLSTSSYIIDDNLQLAEFYVKTGQLENAIEVCNTYIREGNLYEEVHEGATGVVNNNIRLRLPFYEILARCYKAAKNFTAYQETLEKIIAAKDSLYQSNSAEAIVDLQLKYEVQKKETTIIQQKLDLVKKNNLIYGSLALVLFITFIAYITFTNFRKKQKLRLERMQEEEKRISALAVIDAEEKERRRISADLHDNLGAYAHAVLYNTELLQQEEDQEERKELINDLQYASKDIITSLRETIWALKKDMFTAEDCLLRIRNYVQPFTRYYPTINFVVEGSAPEHLTLHGSRALHLVRMVQEAVNNAIKHAAASQITIASSSGRLQWKIVVEDNGKGFPELVPTPGNEQNGLANLRERAAAANIQLSIQSEPGKGTTVQLLIAF